MRHARADANKLSVKKIMVRPIGQSWETAWGGSHWLECLTWSTKSRGSNLIHWPGNWVAQAVHLRVAQHHPCSVIWWRVLSVGLWKEGHPTYTLALYFIVDAFIFLALASVKFVQAKLDRQPKGLYMAWENTHCRRADCSSRQDISSSSRNQSSLAIISWQLFVWTSNYLPREAILSRSLLLNLNSLIKGSAVIWCICSYIQWCICGFVICYSLF